MLTLVSGDQGNRDATTHTRIEPWIAIHSHLVSGNKGISLSLSQVYVRHACAPRRKVDQLSVAMPQDRPRHGADRTLVSIYLKLTFEVCDVSTPVTVEKLDKGANMLKGHVTVAGLRGKRGRRGTSARSATKTNPHRANVWLSWATELRLNGKSRMEFRQPRPVGAEGCRALPGPFGSTAQAAIMSAFGRAERSAEGDTKDLDQGAA